MDKITYYHLQHGDEIKANDEYYINKSAFGPRWHTVKTKDVGRKYDAATRRQ